MAAGAFETRGANFFNRKADRHNGTGPFSAAVTVCITEQSTVAERRAARLHFHLYTRHGRDSVTFHFGVFAV